MQEKLLIKHFILPLLIPGSGKSTLGKELLSIKKSKFIWKIIDSDSIRRGLME
jgi:adenylylsulfate kinase-like enzyme